MAIVLSDHEAAPGPEGDVPATQADLRARLTEVQRRHRAHGRRAMIVVEGWDPAGEGDAIAALAAAWDPRFVRAWRHAPATADEQARHFLWRFWTRLPGAGEIALFDGSWYDHVLGERVAGRVAKPQWRRGYDEINEFEAQQKDSGTILVKLFLHVSAEEQRRRLRALLDDPWTRALLDPAALRLAGQREASLAALDEMFGATDTRWAPWTVIDAGDRDQARLAVLGHVATALEKALPATAPAENGALTAVARDLELSA